MLVFVKDLEMRSVRYAQQAGIPYVAFSDFSFDIAPIVSQFIQAPKSAPIVLLGHVVGGTATLAALHFAKEFRTISSIAITGVVGVDDTGGPASKADFERYAKGGHGALILRDGAFVWLKDGAAMRTIVDGDGVERTAFALPLLDVTSLAARTAASSIRVDLAIRGSDEKKSFTGIIIEISGTRGDGARTTLRATLVDEDVHARISAYGAALVAERLVGLRGEPPVAPGLYAPESILDPEASTRRLEELGVRVNVVRTDEPRLTIGIIGSGNIGGALTRRLRRLGHEIYVANSRGPASLAELASETGAHAVDVHEAARRAEIVIVAIPQAAVDKLPSGLFDGASERTVVIDTCNYYPRHRDGRIEPIEAGRTESRWVADTLGRPVVKAFNNIWAHDLMTRGRPRGAADRFALPIAGDDATAKAKVISLLNELGFDGVDAGGLDDSWRQQPGTPVYTANRDSAGTRELLAAASKQRPAELSGSAASPGTWTDPR
jgi:predicted dinucleotide-binding enzyme